MYSRLMVRSPTAGSTPLGERIELGLLGLSTLAIVVAAYHAGTTGNWMPLMAASVATGALVALTSR